MARRKITQDLSTLQMALVGFEVEKQRIEEKIGEIQALLKGKPFSSQASANKPQPAGGGRILSAAARRRISAAQKKRWAEARKRKALAAMAT